MRPTRGRKIEYGDEFEHENDYGNDCEIADPQMRPGVVFSEDRRVRCFLDAVVQEFLCTLRLQHEPGTDGVPETRRRLPNTIGRVAALAQLLFESVPAGVLENEHCPTLATS
jgi:hypothetical protein